MTVIVTSPVDCKLVVLDTQQAYLRQVYLLNVSI
jgi:hypothetical protein